jgi:methyl-accepting chemotaxis protein
MEDMTSKLVAAIDNLSKNLGSMHQDALQTMMKDFAVMIKESTSEEMTAFKDSLGKLSERLNAATITLAVGAEKTSEGLGQAAKDLSDSVGRGAQSLTDAAALLDAAMTNAKESIANLGSTISTASELGKAGTKRFEQSLVQTDAVLQKMQLAKDSWSEAIAALGATAGTLSNAVDSLEELTTEQHGVVNAVKSAMPNALESVKQVSLLLEQTALSAEKAMHEARDAMERTGKTLGGTVSAITDGVESYSKQLANLHQSLDSQVSKAVTSIGGAITSLEEAVEELGEILEAKLPKH